MALPLDPHLDPTTVLSSQRKCQCSENAMAIQLAVPTLTSSSLPLVISEMGTLIS